MPPLLVEICVYGFCTTFSTTPLMKWPRQRFVDRVPHPFPGDQIRAVAAQIMLLPLGHRRGALPGAPSRISAIATLRLRRLWL